MRISLNWLRELVDLSLTPVELAHTLTMAGFEVEEIEDRRTWADGVVVGKILTCEPHPNADKLRVCTVEVGQANPLNIVCGAPNARADILVPVATVGTYLPKIDLKIRPAKLRGVPSEGMICSLAELGLMKESAGIHIFDQEIPVGTDARPLLGLDDVILDLTSTANRADALSLVGVAREVAALTGATLRIPCPEIPQLPAQAELLTVQVQESAACPTYIGTVIEGVKIGPSPEWLQRRLQGAGLRPINNVVDITNYILLEWGQPLHAFDRDRLLTVSGATAQAVNMGVRFAESGETLTTLDGQSRNLQSQNLVITAGGQPVALAGVMGGETTEVHGETQNLMLEAALFDPATIRRSARSQSLRTEASGRYERGVNQAELAIANARAIALIQEMAGGTPVAQQMADTRSEKLTETRSIELRLSRINQVLGPVELGEEEGEITADDVERILTALGCQLTRLEGKDEIVWAVVVPPYRYRDLEREIDLIEEVARLYGYDRFCETLPGKTEPGYLPEDQALVRQIRSAFRAAGLTELVQYSYALDTISTSSDTRVSIVNPMFTEYSSLRTELMSGLIEAFQYNLEQGNGPLNGFEIGHIFWREEEGLAEGDALAGILGGDSQMGKWVRGGKDQPMTWFEAKGILESVFQSLGLTVEYQPDRREEHLHPGRTASLWLRGTRLGTFGQLHPKFRQEKGLPDEVYIFQLDLDVLMNDLTEDDQQTPLFQPFSTYPASSRDIAFFAPKTISVADLQKSIRKAGGTLLESVELFDEYQGQNVPTDQRSLAFNLVYRTSDRTLTDADVDPVQQKVRETLVEKFGVTLRS